jgi:hypothetical protein
MASCHACQRVGVPKHVSMATCRRVGARAHFSGGHGTGECVVRGLLLEDVERKCQPHSIEAQLLYPAVRPTLSYLRLGVWGVQNPFSLNAAPIGHNLSYWACIIGHLCKKEKNGKKKKTSTKKREKKTVCGNHTQDPSSLKRHTSPHAKQHDYSRFTHRV